MSAAWPRITSKEAAMSNLSKIIRILDPQAGRLQESILEEKPVAAENLFEQATGC